VRRLEGSLLALVAHPSRLAVKNVEHLRMTAAFGAGNPSSSENTLAKMDRYAGVRRAEGLQARRRVKPAYDARGQGAS
jgi:hypothetical protein